MLQRHLHSFSELYVVERHEGVDGDGLPVAAMVRLWRNGSPVAHTPLKEIGINERQHGSFSVVAGRPDEPSSAGQDSPTTWKPLGLTLQSQGPTGWKAYIGSNVLTLSYGKDAFFSVDLAKGLGSAMGLIRLAYAQMPPKSQRVFVFDESDSDLTGRGWLVPLLQELGLRAQPLKLAQPFFWLPWALLKTAPRGLLSGLLVLSFLLASMVFWKPFEPPSRTANRVELNLGSGLGPAGVPGEGPVFFLEQVAQALLASGTFEIDRISLQHSGMSSEPRLEFDLVQSDFASPLNREALRGQLKKLPGVLDLEEQEESGLRFVARLKPQALKNSGSSKQGLKPLSADDAILQLSELSRRSALVLGEPKSVSSGWRLEAVQQPTSSAIRFLQSLPAEILSGPLQGIEIRRTGSSGLVSLRLEIAS